MKVAMRNNCSFTLAAPLVAGDEKLSLSGYSAALHASMEGLPAFFTLAIESAPVIEGYISDGNDTAGTCNFWLNTHGHLSFGTPYTWAGATVPFGTVLEMRVTAEMIARAANQFDELTAKYAILIANETPSFTEAAAVSGFVCIGDGIEPQKDCVAIGGWAGSGENGVAIGRSSTCASGAVAIGKSARAAAADAVAIGRGAEALNSYSVALGRGSSSIAVCHADISALFCLPSAAADGTPLDADDKLVRHRAVPMSAISSQVINLGTVAGAVQVDLPSGMRIYIDRIDVIQTATSTATTTPRLSIGTSSTEKTSILAASDVTVAAQYARQSFTPATAAGVTSIYIDVPTAANAAKNVRVVFAGYLAA